MVHASLCSCFNLAVDLSPELSKSDTLILPDCQLQRVHVGDTLLHACRSSTVRS
jgi:hypothetical protein